MGQQQLLLVILVTIIVGIATVVAINTFGAAADSANLDAVRQDMGSIAASAQGYYMKPEMLGGGGKDFTGMTFENVAFGGTINSGNSLLAFNENGTYVLGAGSTDGIDITGHPSSCEDYEENTTSACSGDDQLEATIEPDNLTWTN